MKYSNKRLFLNLYHFYMEWFVCMERDAFNGTNQWLVRDLLLLLLLLLLILLLELWLDCDSVPVRDAFVVAAMAVPLMVEVSPGLLGSETAGDLTVVGLATVVGFLPSVSWPLDRSMSKADINTRANNTSRVVFMAVRGLIEGINQLQLARWQMGDYWTIGLLVLVFPSSGLYQMKREKETLNTYVYVTGLSCVCMWM